MLSTTTIPWYLVYMNISCLYLHSNSSNISDQLSSSQAETESLRDQLRSRENQLEELQQARDLLASDAQVGRSLFTWICIYLM